MCAWDASADVPQDAWEDAARPQVALPGADAGKSAVREPDVLAQGAQQSELPVAPALPDAAVGLCTPDADRSAGRSFAAQVDRA